MEINTSSWHYLLWKLTYVLNAKEPPARVSLCRYVTRTIFYPIPVAVLFVISVLAFVVYLILKNAVLLLLGIGVWGFTEATNKDGKKTLMWYFPPLTIAGRHVKVWWLVVSLYVLSVLALYAYVFWDGVVNKAVGIGIGGGLFLAIFAISLAVSRIRGSDTWKIFRAYLKAKKEGVCPIVSFTDAPTPAAS